MKRASIYLFIFLVLSSCTRPKTALVIQTDFGLKDGAVNAMKGVAFNIDRELPVYDLTHEIPTFDIWTAGYRLYQSAPFWPAGTVFVSVVDPGVGTNRKSIVMQSANGLFFVTPDNGTITLVSDALGITAVREIDEHLNRRPGSEGSFTFHGRDVYMYTAARLAAGKISFEEVGPLLKGKPVLLDYQKPILTDRAVKGNIPVLDVQYGNVWTNVHDSLFSQLHIQTGEPVNVQILYKDSVVFVGHLPYANTFGDVAEKKPLAYLNSLMNFSVAINMGNFADSFRIGSGKDWSIILKKE